MEKCYVKALNKGKEIVIVASEKCFNSAVFWKQNGVYYCFTREFGIMERTDLDDKQMARHICEMINENAQIFMRGMEVA